METIKLNDSLTLLSLKQNMEGFDSFVGSWVFQGEPCVVFDVGPAASIHILLDYLRQKNIDRVDYVFPSHIHIDHAGGLAQFLESYPMAKVVVHDMGVRHLVDPSKLWAGALKTLGYMAEAYGEIKPVPEEALIPHSTCDIKGVTVLETPGHAPHHLSYVFKDHLFSGESAGVYLPHIAENYLRPPTPPRFILEIAVSSVERMLDLDDLPVCFAHFGYHRSSHAILENYRKQLYFWRDVIAEEAARGNEEGLVERCAAMLLEKDPALAAFPSLDAASKKREMYFIENGVRGYLGYLKEKEVG